MDRKNLKKKNIQKLILAFTVIIAINILSSFFFNRIDLTAEKRYTLSDYTENYLKNYPYSILVKVYLDGDMPANFKRLKNAVRETLDEFKVYAGDRLQYEFINPAESPDKDVRYAIYKELYDKGIIPVEVQQTKEGAVTQNMIFPAAVITVTANIKNTDGKDTTLIKELGFSFLKNDPKFPIESDENINNSIETLEYEFINAITKVSQMKKPHIAFIEGHGEIPEENLVDISSALSEYYDVRRGKIDGRVGILDRFKAIIIAKPTKPFSEADKFAIDQYIMKGGKVLWLVEGAAVDMDSLADYPSTVAMPLSLNLEDQLFKYGARVNYDLVQDMQCASIGLAAVDANGQTRIQFYPWYYFPIIVTSNLHPITKYIDLVRTEFISSVDTVGDSPFVKRHILLKSSKYTKLTGLPAPVDFSKIHLRPDEHIFNDGAKPVAVLLEGKFESLYNNRAVKKFINPKEFRDSSVYTKMIVVGDGDIIKNEITEKNEILPVGYDRPAKRVFKGNKEFIINAINYLCDDAGLMNLRNREIKLRLLDKQKIKNNRLILQSVNTIVPVLLIALFGFLMFVLRKRKYEK